MIRKCSWNKLDMELEEIVPVWTILEAWRFNGVCKIYWIHVRLSFIFSINHLHKHHRGALDHYKPWIARFKGAALQEVDFRSHLFSNSLWYLYRSLIGDHSGIKFEWNGALFMKIHAFEVLMSIFLFFDLSDAWCFSVNCGLVLHVHGTRIRLV